MELCHFSFFFGTSMENTFPFPSPRKDSCFQLEQPPPVTESMNCGTKPRPKVHWHGSMVGEGNGTPLQCSCLENPRDREPFGLPSTGSHRVGHDWSDLAAAAELTYTSWEECGLLQLAHPDFNWDRNLSIQPKPGDEHRKLVRKRSGNRWLSCGQAN